VTACQTSDVGLDNGCIYTDRGTNLNTDRRARWDRDVKGAMSSPSFSAISPRYTRERWTEAGNLDTGMAAEKDVKPTKGFVQVKKKKHRGIPANRNRTLEHSYNIWCD